ncbi:pantoate--beta-alanine ligase [Flavobacterium aquatile]|uniref:Pantothenate synthetase n=1 Tax=Flavobacterium aquatile LMG 4008 = ATCC 11947 TaxID=1453498 RepID=A0A095U2Y4_9FLAO|nr:pantoate--beta-alanine ligase [Flavobacterium aquatile]KGD68958.1 pantothenate synthetase [Flavobacterium aquatile LMG 4008 = ATCC 11947]OXA65669.1 pantoate--beta-alanine ligase [Flavobacterium aquatile LMG 4008 = ATCC 11947]GEC79607.1 pantothenate synthetase [Flavobacterium aquatile]
MNVFNNKADLNSFINNNNSLNSTIGFVPTMGALHNGHLSLLKKSTENNSLTVISIFVNPTQFNNQEDLAKYPRTLENDVEKIKSVSNKIIVYAPTVDDIYEGNTKSNHYNFDGLEHQMEGKFRPGHFDGVGTVVKRLFEIVNPTNAYFGEKDFQQLQIVKKLVEKEKLSVNIIGCPIFRESNGLAMSSRNERLTSEEKTKASIIFKTINQAKILFGTKSAKEVSEFVSKTFKNNQTFELEYFEIADEATLLPCIRKSKNKKYRGFIAVFVNKIRLIDTISF